MSATNWAECPACHQDEDTLREDYEHYIEDGAVKSRYHCLCKCGFERTINHDNWLSLPPKPEVPMLPVGTLVLVKRTIVDVIFPVLGAVTATNSAEGYSPYKVQHGNCSMWFSRDEIIPVEVHRLDNDPVDGLLSYDVTDEECVISAADLGTLFNKEPINDNE